MSKKTKVITSNVQPNPKEAEIWAKINKDGSREVKQYNNSTGKFECCGGSGNGSDSNVNLASFNVLNFTWEYEEGMTWKEFYASKYCIPKYDETTDTVYNIIRDSDNNNMPRICANVKFVGNLYDDITTENDVIINGHTYEIDG